MRHDPARSVSRPDDPDRGHVRRVTHRGLAGAILGIAAGVGVGVTAGAINFEGIGPVLGCAVAGAVAGGLLGTFIGGMTGLESPAPGREPSETDRPILDVPEPTDVERDGKDRTTRSGGTTSAPRNTP